MIGVRSRISSSQIFTTAITIVLAIFACRLILYPESQLLLFLGTVLAAIAIFASPVLGMAAYLLIYPMVPATESLNPLKAAVFVLTLLLLFVWVVRKSIVRKGSIWKSEYNWIYLFFIFLGMSPILGMFGGFTIIDWARDIAPMLNLLLIPVMADYFGSKKNHWLLYLVFVLLWMSMVREMLALAASYGFPVVGVSTMTALPSASIHTSIGLGLGLIMFLQKTPHRLYWLALAVISLAVAVLTPTRTVWITTATMVLLIIFFSAQGRRRLWLFGSVGVMACLIGFALYYSPGSSNFMGAQRGRVDKFVHYQDDPSAENRMDEIKETAALFQASPLYGVGFGYQYIFWRHTNWAHVPGYVYSNFTHNDIMFIASKGGLIGLALFVIMLFRFAKKLSERRKREPGTIQSAWATIALIALINSIIIGSSTPFYQSRYDLFFLAFLLAMGMGYPKTDLRKKVA